MNKKPNRAHLKETQRYALLGAAFGFTFPLIGTMLEVLFSKLPLNLSNMFLVQRTDPLLWVVDTAPIVISLFTGYAGYKQDLLEKINRELRERELELKNNQINLEQYANERNAELLAANQQNERRTGQLEAIAHITRSISSIQTMSELLPQITQAISEQFDFYHAGIFLLDTNKEYAILVAANSEGGRKMLKKNYRVPVGETDLVGYVTKSGQPRVAFNAGQDSIYFNNPDLPETYSKATLPLRIGSEVFGALDVQSRHTNAFSQEDTSVLTILADQVSVAIQNARSHQQTREALAQAEIASAQLSEQQWKQFLARQNVQGFAFDGLEIAPLTPSDKERPHSLSIPLALRGTKIGTIKLSASDPNRIWTDDEIEMVQAAAERTSLALESARLLKEAQKRAAKERVIGEISARIGSTSDLENLLQIAIQELGKTLPGTDVAVQFSTEKTGD